MSLYCVCSTDGVELDVLIYQLLKRNKRVSQFRVDFDSEITVTTCGNGLSLLLAVGTS